MESKLTARSFADRDILHPNRANISKEELREKLAGLYKAQKDQVNVFGLRTQFGGGKTTGFALVYDSPEAMKKFEPHFRLVRVGLATKIERASRQQRTFPPRSFVPTFWAIWRRRHRRLTGRLLTLLPHNRQAAQEQAEDPPGHGEGQGPQAQEGEISGWRFFLASSVIPGTWRLGRWLWLCALPWTACCIRQI